MFSPLHLYIEVMWVHRLLSKDISNGTGVCKACGHVRLVLKSKGVFRCNVPRLVRKFGISEEEAILLMRKMNCEICGQDGWLVTDHDHKTNKVRGALCRNCNKALGLFQDSKEIILAASKYLEQTPPSYLY